MPGKFCGLTDAVWAIIEPLLPAAPAKPGRGRPHAPFRDILNTIIWVLIMVDNNGNPLSVISTGAAEGERAQIGPLIEQAKDLTGKPGRPKKLPGGRSKGLLPGSSESTED